MENLSFYSKAKNKRNAASPRYQPHELLIMYRERSGLTKQDLARLLGFSSERMLQKWEGGYNLPIALRLKKIISIYLDRGVFLPEKEVEEARELWQAVKEYYDATNPSFEAYPVFDQDWFENRVLQSKSEETIPPQEKSPTTTQIPPSPHNLPIQLSSFIGRHTQIQAVSELLSVKNKKLVTLVGPGGIGKTRLALEIAHQLLRHYPDGVWYVELAAGTTPDFVAQKIAQVLSLREAPGQNTDEMLVTHLRPLSLLLLLDNCEHMLNACANLSEKLLKACPHLQIMTTSREVLGVPGESSWPVLALSLPLEGETITPAALLEYEAAQLFMDRATAVNPHFQLTEGNSKALVRICRLLEGIPLALELAAARTKLLSLEQINERLISAGGPFQLLAGAGREKRHDTLEALIDWSYALLSPNEKTLWQRLSVFSGSFSLEAAEQVCSDESNLLSSMVLDYFSQLVNKSLVTVLVAEDANRYRLVETLRQFAREKLIRSGDEPVLKSRHLLYFASLIQQVAPGLAGSGQNVALNLLELEKDNIRASLKWCLDSDSTEHLKTGLTLTQLLVTFWVIRGYFSEGREWIGQFLEAAQRVGLEETPLYAGVLQVGGTLALQQGDYAGANSLLESSLVLFRKLEDKFGLIRTLSRLGVVAGLKGDYVAANAYYAEGLALSQELEHKPALAEFFLNLGITAYRQRDYEKAAEYYQSSVGIYTELGNIQGQALVLNNLGGLAVDTENYSAAKEYYLASLSLKRESGNSRGISTTLTNLGEVSTILGNYEEAELFYRESYSLQIELNDKSGCAYSLHNLGMLALTQNNLSEAGEHFGKCLGILEELEELYLLANALCGIIGLTDKFVTISLQKTVKAKPGGSAKSYLEKMAEICGAIEQFLLATKGTLGFLERKLYQSTVENLLKEMEIAEYNAALEKGKALSAKKAIKRAWSFPFVKGDNKLEQRLQ